MSGKFEVTDTFCIAFGVFRKFCGTSDELKVSLKVAAILQNVSQASHIESLSFGVICVDELLETFCVATGVSEIVGFVVLVVFRSISDVLSF